MITYTDAAAVPGSEGGAQQQAADQHQQHGRGHPAVFRSSPELETKVTRRFHNQGEGPYQGLLLVESVY